MKKAVAKVLRELAKYSVESEAEIKRRWHAIPKDRRAAELTRLRGELEQLRKTLPTIKETSSGDATLTARQRFQEQLNVQSRLEAEGKAQSRRSS